MGGIIVVEFIDMRKSENKKKVFQRIKEEMQSDRSKHTILPLSKFGLMQITRQRVRPEVNIATREVCPTCGGTGKISASIIVADQVESMLEFCVKKQNEKKIRIAVHPYLYAYFTKGLFNSQQWKWFWKYHSWVTVVEDSSLALTEFNFYSKSGEMIEV